MLKSSQVAGMQWKILKKWKLSRIIQMYEIFRDNIKKSTFLGLLRSLWLGKYIWKTSNHKFHDVVWEVPKRADLLIAF